MNRPYTIATLGSHSALQILKGAHDEGFTTLAISNRDTERLYRRSHSSTKSSCWNGTPSS